MRQEPTFGWGTLCIERARLRQILLLALPIIGGMVSQNVLNIVDMLMVGRLGPNALAGVGTGGFLNFLCIAFITGMSAGVQAMAARRKGEGAMDRAADSLNGGLLLVVLMGLPLTVATIYLAPRVFPYLVSDPAVLAVGIPYVQARLVGMIAVGANYAFRGYWNGVNLSKLYLRTLLFMHACNVAFSYILIFGAFGAPEMGATGAGVGTAAATFVGTGYYIYLGRRYARDAGFLRTLPGARTMKSLLALSVPSGLQTFAFAAGFLALFSIVARIGSPELAALSVLINLTLVAILPGLGLGLASASLVGQALGRRDPADAERWGWDVVKVAAVIMGLLGLPMLLAPEFILQQFFDDPRPLYLAAAPLMLVGATIVFDSVGMVLLNSLLGAGATKMAMIVSVVLQWGLFLPAAYLIGPTLGYGLIGVWIAQMTYRSLQALVLAILWRSRRWANVEL